MADLTPFATVVELEAFWKNLSDAEETRASTLLTLSSNRLRVIGENVGVDVDAQHDDSEAYASTLQWVVMEATKRAMLTPPDTPPADTIQTTAGPYSENIAFTNPAGDLWFKKSELHDLGLYGNQHLTSIDSTPNNDIYTPYGSS